MAVTYNPPASDPFNLYKNLTGPQRNAAEALVALFTQYGLATLAPKIIDFIRKGFSADTIAIELQQTAEYKQRFAANDYRIKHGLPALSPNEYIQTERAYRQVLATSGMPQGFYDQQDDFRKFLENDLSPSELQDRVKSWQTEALKDQAGLDAIRKVVGLGVNDYAAYLMDPKRALPILQRTARAVSFAAAAERHGFDISRELAIKYGTQGVAAEDSERGFSAIQEVQADTDRLAKLYGLGGYSVEEAAAETFGGDADVAKKRQRAYGAEKATFSDTSRGSTGKAQSKTSY